MSAVIQEDSASPCIGVCRMSPQTELCEGCFRTIEEIIEWRDYSEQEKREVFARTKDRCERLMNGT